MAFENQTKTSKTGMVLPVMLFFAIQKKDTSIVLCSKGLIPTVLLCNEDSYLLNHSPLSFPLPENTN